MTVLFFRSDKDQSAVHKNYLNTNKTCAYYKLVNSKAKKTDKNFETPCELDLSKLHS